MGGLVEWIDYCHHRRKKESESRKMGNPPISDDELRIVHGICKKL